MELDEFLKNSDKEYLCERMNPYLQYLDQEAAKTKYGIDGRPEQLDAKIGPNVFFWLTMKWQY